MKLTLPAIINPPRFRKDGSCTLSFETRELTPEELVYILGVRNTEGWLLYSNSSEIDLQDVPNRKADVGLKSPSERLADVMYVWYKQETDKSRFVGDFEVFYKQKMETIIEGVKSKLDK